MALKVPVDAHETDTLARALELAATEPANTAMRAAARAYVAREHALEHVGDQYVAALEEALGGGAVRDSVLGDVAEAAADVGIAAEDPEAAELARRLGEVGLAG